MVKNLVRRLLLGTIMILGLASCKPDFFNFIPKATLSAYQKQGSEDNPALVIELDGNDLNGKSDIKEYNVSITDTDGNVIQAISETAPINQEILMNDGTFYVSGECVDSFGATGEDGPIEITIARNNYLPVSNLSITPTSGTAPLEVLIALDGTDGNGTEDIIEYKIEIDNNEDGIADEEIIQDSPINIYKTFSTTTDIYGSCKDSREAISNVGPIKITVSEPNNPPEPVPNPPVPVFSISPTTGDIPLEAIVSISGTRTDADISAYKIWFDENNDGIVNDGEIIIDSSSPVADKKITITETGTKKLYGICTDINSLEGRTQLNEVTVSSSTQPADLREIINFPDSSYSVGGRFTFNAQLTNNTTPLSSITLDNLNRQSLQYRILRKIGKGIYEIILDKSLENEVQIMLNPEGKKTNQGYLITAQQDDDTLDLTIANAYISNGEGASLTIGDTPKTFSPQFSPNHLFEQNGNHILQTRVKYFLEGETVSRTFNFLSAEFVVQ